MARSSRRSRTVTVDFKGVQSRLVMPEDDYLLRVVGAEETTSSNDNEQIEFKFTVASGKFEGQELYFYCPLGEKSLWKLRGLLVALGVEIPDDEMDIDLDELEDKEIMGVVQNEVYEGTKRSKMVDFYACDVAENKSSSRSSRNDDKPPRGGDDDEAAKRRARREARKARRSGETQDDKDETPQDDDRSSRRSSRGSAKKMPKISSDELQQMDEDEIIDVVEKYELKIDLDEYKTLRKKCAAVIDTLEDMGLIDDN